MKKVIKNYWIIIIALLFLSLFIGFLFEKDYIDTINLRNKLEYESCTDYKNINNYSNKNNYTEEQLERIKPWNYCDELLKYDEVTYSTFYIFDKSILNLYQVLPILVFLIIIFPFVYEISQIFKNRQVKSILLREDYKKFVKKIFKKAYKNIWLAIIPFVLFFLFCYIYSGHFYLQYEIDNGIIYDLNLIKNPLFYIEYLVVVLLNLGLYINIGLIILSKNNNFIITLIESCVVILVVWFGIEVLGQVLQGANILSEQYFYGLDIFRLNHYFDLKIVINIGIYLLMFVASFIFAVSSYNSKEKIIHMCEK